VTMMVLSRGYGSRSAHMCRAASTWKVEVGCGASNPQYVTNALY
jgi:hypothetical protein